MGRTSLIYIENENSDGGRAGVIISAYDNGIIIGVTEEHGADAEVLLNIDMANELLKAIEAAIELAKGKDEETK